MTPGSNEWRWVDANGVDRSIDRRDLIAALVDGTLSAETLVWRPGWSEWIPASRVAELAPALPAEKVKPSRTPPHDPRMTHPPPLLDGVPTLSRSGTFNGEFDAPTVPGLSRGVPLAVSTERGSLPTLVEEEGLGSATTTLRPPGAVPPPPRAVPRTGITAATPGIPIEPVRHQTPAPGTIRVQHPPVDVAPVAHPPAAFESPPPMIPRAQIQPPQRAEGFPQSSPPRELRRRPALPTIPDTDEALKAAMFGYPTQSARNVSDAPPPVSELDDRGANMPGAGYAPQPMPTSSAPAPPNLASEASDFRPGVALIALAAVSAVVAIGALVLLFFRTDTRPDAPTVTAVPSAHPADAEAQKAVAGCTVVRTAQRIGGPVELSIPPYLDQVPGDSRFALGFAAKRTTGLGFAVDPTTLTAQKIFEEGGPRNVLGVVPVVNAGKLDFVVDRDDLPLKYARTINATPLVTVGVVDRGFAQWTRGTTPRLVWEGGGDEAISEPRVATFAGFGYAITFRRGGQNGPILFGWMGLDGSAKTQLSALETEAFKGNPMVAANDAGVLVAFAARPTKDSPWGIRLAFAGRGQTPSAVQAFASTSSGSLISPVVAGLPGGNWALQWTEASGGSYQVKVQVLGQDLRAGGQPVTVSPAGLNAGQGALWTSSDRAVALFIVSQGQTREIWGATLTCR